MNKQLWQRPVFFDRNRVYLGGKLFHDFLGDAPESIRRNGSHPRSTP